MEKFTIVTNNSIVLEFYNKKELPVEIKWVATPATDVVSVARSAVHQGAVMLSNPLTGVRTAQPSSIFSQSNTPPAPGRAATSKITSINPYLSILLSPLQDVLDFSSSQRLDEALKLFKRNARLRIMAQSDDAIKAFQTSDLESIAAAVNRYIT